jgi:hypothetical protein
MEQIKKGRGGKRKGAGRNPKYGEPTVNITFRVPASSKELIRAMVKTYLDNLNTQPKNKLSEYGC